MFKRSEDHNIMLATDSYKASHYRQYPLGTQTIYSYFESRGGEFDSTVFFGLQYYLKRYLEGVVVTKEKIDEAEAIINAHMGAGMFNRAGWEHILNKHGGKLPVSIKAVAEGSAIPTHNILMSIENTDPVCYWLTNWLETLLVQVWYPTTVATLSYNIKKMITSFLEETGDPSGLLFKFHDFGYRGVSSQESAALGGAGHLVNFRGTDTMAAIMLAREYYGAEMPGFSIPAAEHSTITSWGREHEVDAFRTMLDKYPSGLVAVVSDSFDIYAACSELWGKQLKDKVIGRDGTVVVRPDCYDEQTEILTSKGWKFFKDLLPEDLVAQYDEERVVSFVKPLKYVDEAYAGDMIKFEDQKGRLDLLVTPNHRMVRWDWRRDEADVQEANDVKYHYHKHLPFAGFKKNGRSLLTPRERLWIAFQADGSYPSRMERYTGEQGGKKQIRFNFTKQRKADRMVEICKLGGFEYSVHHEHARPQNYSIYVTVTDWPSKVFDWVNLEDVNADWCREFVEEMSHWDATRRSSVRFKYDSTVAGNTQVIQSICALGGMRCVYHEAEDKREKHFSNVHTLHITTDKSELDGQGITKTVVPYEGRIYCVTVPSGMLVVRRNRRVCVSGNSGHPPTVVLEVLRRLGDAFGYTTNSKGYKVLDPHIRVIQGDGVDYDMTWTILDDMKDAGWSADNIAFGCGGALLQKLNRDTLRFAFKCASATINGVEQDVYKQPVTDSGKNSKRGRQALIRDPNGYMTVSAKDAGGEDQLIEVFRDGSILQNHSWDEICLRAK